LKSWLRPQKLLKRLSDKQELGAEMSVLGADFTPSDLTIKYKVILVMKTASSPAV
jgi:hypothetical protein